MSTNNYDTDPYPNTENLNNYLNIQQGVFDSDYSSLPDAANSTTILSDIQSLFSNNLNPNALSTNIDGQSIWNLSIQNALNGQADLTYKVTGSANLNTTYYVDGVDFAKDINGNSNGLQFISSTLLSPPPTSDNHYAFDYNTLFVTGPYPGVTDLDILTNSNAIWESYTQTIASSYIAAHPAPIPTLAQVAEYYQQGSINGNQEFVNYFNNLYNMVNFKSGEGFLQLYNQGAPIPQTFQAYVQFLTSNSVGGVPLLTLTAQSPPTATNATATANSTLGSLFSQFLALYPSVQNGQAATVSNFFSSFFTTLAAPLSSSGLNGNFQIYIDDSSSTTPIFYKTVAAPGGNLSIVGNNYSTQETTTLSNIVAAFQADFNSALSFSNDWTAAGITLTTQQQTTLFNNTFEAFITAIENGNITINNNGTASGLSDFLTKWSEFVGPSVLLDGTTSGPGGTASTMTSYLQIYNTFFPSGSSQSAANGGFLNLLNQFITQYLQSSGGVFSPSLMADQWFQTVSDQYFSSIGITVGTQPLLASDFSETKIFFAIFNLLLQMLGDLQRLTASQASYDLFLTQYQNAYTQQIAKIPGDLYGSNIPSSNPSAENISSSSSSSQIQLQSTLEGDIYNANQKFITNLNDYSSSVADVQKNLTSTINQSVEETNQQASLMTQILQELQSILQSIWR